MNRSVLSSGLLLLALLSGSFLGANELMFSWDDPGQVSRWSVRSATQDTLEISTMFGTSGPHSLRFATPRWQQGMQEWPAFDAAPEVADWRGFDRAVVDLINPEPQPCSLSVLVSDSKERFQQGLSHRFQLPAHSYRRFVIPLSLMPESIDRSRIALVHFFTERPAADMSIHLGGIWLLRPGEEPADPPADFVGQIATVARNRLALLDERIAQCRVALAGRADQPVDRSLVDAELDRVADHVLAVRRQLSRADITLEEIAAAERMAESLRDFQPRVESVLRLRQDFARLPFQTSPVLVGFASSMVKLMPRDMPFELSVSRDVQLALARNEHESFQVAVMPRDRTVQGVHVSVSDLTSATGDVLSASQIDCDVMGYVRTKQNPPYAVSHVGWWPDPILDFLEPVDIAEGDLQSFWVRVRAPRDQPAGNYQGTLRVHVQGTEPLEFGLSIRVYDFTLPRHTPLPTAITFFEHPAQMGGSENWPTMKLRYADFLADYYIDYDSLYRGGPPDFEIVEHLHKQGRLVAFNLGNVFNAGTKEEGFDAAIAETVNRLRPAYDEAKRRGLLDFAYIYGFDERPEDQFTLLERSAQALKEAFPEVLLMTTSYDHSFGLDSVVKTIDAWCPLTPRFVPELADRARAGGKYVWWYICCGPHNPHANWFVEYAAIESRLLMGAMTAKMRPDGFLYYSLTIWNDNQPIESGPFTQWDPVSWTVYHGDGSLLCAGPGGKPVPTIRLENYRDGLEDFAYACILEEIVQRVTARAEVPSDVDERWLAEARAALEVPTTLVSSMAEYSRDPAALYAFRNRLGELIDRSGISDANPWGDRFGVRGFTRESQSP